MKIKGCGLQFISQIDRDGSGTSDVSDEYLKILNDEYFNIQRLSMSEETYIAAGFNSFVVKLKPLKSFQDAVHRILTELIMLCKDYGVSKDDEKVIIEKLLK